MAVEANIGHRPPDRFWAAAYAAAERALEEADYVLVPAEFLPLDPRFAPLEYSWALEPGCKIAWCCSKDDVDRIAPQLLAAAESEAFYAWSNEVFVLGASFPWARAPDAESRRHLVAWWERVERYRAGKPARPARERPVASAVRYAAARSAEPRRVLVVGASGMGNVGDDLLAAVLAEKLANRGCDVFLSGPDIDPLRVASYDAVVVGGGGLIYASRDGSVETQNLANYLKLGPICRAAGVPVAMIGVGDQDHAGGIARDALTQRFARSALAHFPIVTTRDRRSAELLASLGAVEVAVGPDLLLLWADRAKSAVRPTVRQPGRIALVGELFRFDALARALGSPDAPLAAIARDADFDLLVMSDDDRAHAERMHAVLSALGASASIVDLRGRAFEALIFSFASYSGVVTTRFHGLLLAALAGTPVLALDATDGKCARLLTDLDVARCLLTDAGEQAVDRLGAALRGDLATVPLPRLERIAAQAQVHLTALNRLLGLEPTFRSGRSTFGNADGAARRASRTRSQALADLRVVPLCWAASTAETKGYANLGDSLSAVIVAALAGRPVRHTSFDAQQEKLVAVGSIGHAIKGGTALVWGCGVSIRGGVLAQNAALTRYDVRAMRGRISAQHYRDFGIEVPDAYGDPVWLLPSITHEDVEKRYELGVIPHIRDVADHHPDAPARSDSRRYRVSETDAGSIVVINTWHTPTWDGLLEKLRLIRSCKRIVSQSFHGVVIAEAYGIPVLNFRHEIGAKDGVVRVDLTEPCTTDPRVWEFYDNGPRREYFMYSQRRDNPTDWEAVIRAVDAHWEPFLYDAEPLVQAFPLPLAYDPLRERAKSLQHVKAIEF